MQSKPYPQANSQKSDIKRSETVNLVHLSPPDDEGGLKLGQILQSLQRQLPLIVGVTVMVTTLGLFRSLTSKPTYQASFEILAKPITEETRVISAVTLSNREVVNGKNSVDPTTLKLLKSPKVINPIVDQLKSKYPDINYESLSASLILKVLEDEILNVSYEDKDSTKVKAILDLVSNAYLEYSLEERLAEVRLGIDFVDSQLKEVQERASKLQDQLQSFRQQYNLIDPESTSKQLATQISTVSQQRLENKIKLDEAYALMLDLDSQLANPSSNSKVSVAFQDNARYQSLLSQIQGLEIQIAKDLSVFQESTDKIKVLRDQQTNLLTLLSQEAERTKELLTSRIRELESRSEILSQAEEQLNQQVKQLSIVSRQYTDIQQEIKITNDNLNQFLTKREALRIDAGQRKTPWQILTPLKDPVASSSDTKRSALLGAILGLLLGIGVALLRDKLSNLLRTPNEVKDISKLPMLGVIPFNSVLISDKKQDGISDLMPLKQSLIDNENQTAIEKLTKIINLKSLLQGSHKRLEGGTNYTQPYYMTSMFLEAFRSLYTNIRLLSPDDKIRSIVISSSLPSEGKSTTSVYLAQAAAALGKRVLLVDADLRRPTLHDRLQFSNARGLSNLISSNLSFDEVVQQSPIEPNLSILTSGQLPPDPTRLISSQKMQSLMQLFQETFDLVIYDTPPLIGMVDAKLLASETDGIIIVVGLDKTKVSSLNQSLELLSNSPIVVFGMVANGSKDYSASLNDTYKLYY
ncbi:MAG: polysaccharide biosynthesis tyrosine autokinase [Pseudanabaena sp. Salubria-1]|jgi:capsular exopolysaccharide synthesis family protein|nr:polysaccharide biosynthesis tyrosine autokinase [Pseudanabaena sp. Salubria-1]